MSWFSTGDAGNEKVDKEVERQESSQDQVYRHWMPPDSEQHLTFLDAEKNPAGYESPFVFEEHNVCIGGDWKNWFTCIEGIPHPDTGKPQRCPLCAEGDKAYIASAYTVIDHNEWTSKSTKKTHKHELKLFVCKTQVQKILRKNAKKRKGLRGWLVEVSRTDKKAPNTGDQFDFERRFKTKEEFIEFSDSKYETLPEPLPYHEIFAPKTEEEILALLSTPKAKADYGTKKTKKGYDESSFDNYDDDEIPF